MNALDALMTPVRTAISWVLLHAVRLLGLVGLQPTQGATWFAAVALLVIVVRLALIPLFLRQIRTARATAAMAPSMRALQARYRGRTDPQSRRRMAEEAAALRREHGAGLLGCLPMLLQAPVFYALFQVLRTVSQDHEVGLLGQDLVDRANSATFLGAHLADTVLTAQSGAGRVVAALVVLAAAVATLVSQRRQQRLNTPVAAPGDPSDPGDAMATTTRRLVYLGPVTLLLSGLWLPLGVLAYWLVSNVWALAQQLMVIRYLPSPGTPAHERYTRRRAAEAVTADGAVIADPARPGPVTPRPQRVQPVSRARSRRRR
ncbi:membrane protein insertase YidC [Cellulomonas hominis]